MYDLPAMARFPRRWTGAIALVLGLPLLLALLHHPLMFDPLLRQMLYPAPPLAVGDPPPGLAEVTLDGGDGERVFAWAGGAGAAAGRPLVIFFHGNGENLETMRRAGLFGELARLEVPYLAVDYPGYGRSGGVPSEESLGAAADAALAWAGEEHPGRPVVACGWSLGAAVSSQLAARHPGEIAGIALLSPWTTLSDVAARHFPALIVRPALRGHYDTLAAAGQADLPALVIHGGRDRIIPVEQGEQVAAALGSRARWVRVDEAGHNDLLAFPIVWEELERFFAAVAR